MDGRFECVRGLRWGISVAVVLAGCLPAAGDADGDGLSNDAERQGWEVTIENGAGALEEPFRVRSDPKLADTDGDGLSDAEEARVFTDPTSEDTDGDGLSDYDEVIVFASSPTDVDTDDDSRGADGSLSPAPRLFDGNELLQLGTSPTLFDTDGDGKHDFTETTGGGFDPLVAEVPKVNLRITGSPLVELVLTCTEGDEVESDTFSSSLEGSSSAYSTTDTDATKSTTRTMKSVQGSLTFKAPPPRGTAKVTAKSSVQKAMTREQTTSVSASSAQSAQSEHRRSERARSERSCVDDNESRLKVTFELANVGQRTFTLTDLTITALRRSPVDAEDFSPVATLRPELCEADGKGGESCEVVMGPGASTGPIVAEVSNLTGTTAAELLANPSGLFFEIANYALLITDDESGEPRNFEVFSEGVSARTAMLVVDYGAAALDEEGLAIVENHLVATNVFRNPDGSNAGITLKEALDTAGVVFTTAPYEEGSARTVLDSVAGVDSGPRSGWMVFASADSFDDPEVSFEDHVLRARDRVTLVYLTDQDEDGLYAREEHLLGTDDNNPDTDGDGLEDGEEARDGWEVQVTDQAAYQTWSSPVLVDTDGDGCDDPCELAQGTDPILEDTDGDGLGDDDDPEPLTPAPSVTYVVVVDSLVLLDEACEGEFAPAEIGFDFVWQPRGGVPTVMEERDPAVAMNVDDPYCFDNASYVVTASSELPPPLTLLGDAFEASSAGIREFEPYDEADEHVWEIDFGYGMSTTVPVGQRWFTRHLNTEIGRCTLRLFVNAGPEGTNPDTLRSVDCAL